MFKIYLSLFFLMYSSCCIAQKAITSVPIVSLCIEISEKKANAQPYDHLPHERQLRYGEHIKIIDKKDSFLKVCAFG